MQFVLTWRCKCLTSEARSLGDMAQSREDTARHLRHLEQDDYSLLLTDDPEVARKYGFEEAEE